MQRFPCPFCGLRNETEFHFVAEASKKRPEGDDREAADRWADYLYMNDNVKGVSREVWLHLSCNEFFAFDRNTLTHDVYDNQRQDEAGQ